MDSKKEVRSDNQVRSDDQVISDKDQPTRLSIAVFNMRKRVIFEALANPRYKNDKTTLAFNKETMLSKVILTYQR